MRLLLLSLVLVLPLDVNHAQADEAPKSEKFRYLRPVADKWETECEFVVDRNAEGWSISSRTFRGKTTLQVSSFYDSKDQLRRSEIALKTGEEETRSTIQVERGVALVKSANQDPKEFKIPSKVIVTSAPDWTDTFLMCRSYAREKGGKQEFAGLWVHPKQPPFPLTFGMAREGEDKVRLRNQEMKLDRLRITLRNNSQYTAWVDSTGTMIRLVPLPFKAPGGLILEGFEPISEMLKP